MAKGFRSNGGFKPAYSVQASYKSKSGEYKRLSLTGLFPAKDGAGNQLGQGSMKEDRLKEAAEFFTKAAKFDKTVYLVVWDNRADAKKKARIEDEDDAEDTEDDVEDEPDEDEV